MSQQVPWQQLMPQQPAEFQMPFWYSSLQSFWLYYPARRDLVEALLPDLPAGHGMRVAEFSGAGRAGARVARLPGLHIRRQQLPRLHPRGRVQRLRVSREQAAGGAADVVAGLPARPRPDQDDRWLSAARAVRQPHRRASRPAELRRTEVAGLVPVRRAVAERSRRQHVELWRLRAVPGRLAAAC